MKNKFIMKLLTIFSATFPMLFAISCGAQETIDKTTFSGMTKKSRKETNIIASASTTADQLLAMGIKPSAIANKGLDEHLPYFKKIGVHIPSSYYINPWGTIDVQKLSVLATKADIYFGNLDKKGIISKTFKTAIDNISTGFPFKGSEAESVTIVYSNSSNSKIAGQDYYHEHKFILENYFSRWETVARIFDKKLAQFKTKATEFEDNIINVETKIQNRINKIRIELNKKFPISKSLLVYQWGGKTSPTDTIVDNLMDRSHYQTPISPNGPLGSLLYSKKHGLGFDLPHFDKTKAVLIGKYGYTLKGLKNQQQIFDSLKHQNDFAIFTDDSYNTSQTNYNRVKAAFGFFVKDQKNVAKHLFWMNDASMTTAAYGPLGMSYILDFIVKKFALNKDLLNWGFKLKI